MSIRRLIGVIILISQLLFLLLQVDDPINKEGLKWVESVDYKTPNDSYYYLLGLNVTADKNPLEFGKAKVTQMREWEAKYQHCGNGRQYPFSLEPEKVLIEKFPKSSLKHYKDYYDAVTDVGFSASLKQKERELLRRYRQWLSMKPHRTMDCPTNLLGKSVIGNLIYAHELYLLNVASLFAQKRYQEVRIEVDWYSTQLLEKMNDVSSMTSKLLMFESLSKHLDMIALMAQKKPGLFSEIKIDQKQLTNAEPYFRRELLTSFNSDMSMQALAAYDWPFSSGSEWLEPRNEEFKSAKFTPRWLTKTFYKPNMNFNRTYKKYLKLSQYSRLSSKKFYEAISRECDYDCNWSIFSKFRNYGTYKQRFWSFGYASLYRSYDLVAKLALVNNIIRGNSNVLIQSTINPYTGKADASFNQELNRICFKSSMPKKSNAYANSGYSCVFKISFDAQE